MGEPDIGSGFLFIDGKFHLRKSAVDKMPIGQGHKMEPLKPGPEIKRAPLPFKSMIRHYLVPEC
jgi:hypothetical protein